jgi:type II secretory pathway component GspD/PulD (secretin)
MMLKKQLYGLLLLGFLGWVAWAQESAEKAVEPPPPADYGKIIKGISEDTAETKEMMVYQCKHIRGEGLRRSIENFLTPAGTVSNSDESDIVIIFDEKTQLPLLKKIAESLDQPVPQVLVEARVVEFTIDSNYQKEANLDLKVFENLESVQGLPPSSMDFVRRITDAYVTAGTNLQNTQGSMAWTQFSASNNTLLTAYLKFLESRGRAEILSAPNLILRRGTDGSIITGEEVPIQTQTVTSGSVSTSTQFKSVGIKLRVSPIMISGNRVWLSVSPEVSNVTRVDTSGAPIIAVRNANTELEVLDGQLIALGGLLRKEDRVSERRVPILSQIPLLGHLFKGKLVSTVQSQLVIFLSIRILDENSQIVKPGELTEGAAKHIDVIKKEMEHPPTSMKKDLENFKKN